MIRRITTTSALTMAELRLKHAQLTLAAERSRTSWRGMVSTTPAAAAAGRRTKDLQARADEYASIIEAVSNDD